MIEAKDLRIGDLVKYEENTCRIIGMMRKASGNYYLYIETLDDIANWEVNPRDIAPIPLTPEILEKNEWRNRKEFGEYWFIPRNEDYELLALDKIEDEYSIYIEENCTNFDYIRYVHQLQHLLWALGLNADMEVLPC